MTAPRVGVTDGLVVLHRLGAVFALSLLGDVVVRSTEIPVPGPSVGLILLATIFAFRGAPDAASARLFDSVSPYFPMFFVPAAVGVVATAERMLAAWLPIVAAVLVSTLATLAIAGLVCQALLHLKAERTQS